MLIEPYMKRSRGRGALMLRCDNPHCVRRCFKRPHQDHRELRDLGNDAYKRGRYRKAVALYCEALSVVNDDDDDDEDRVALLSNRAAAWLKLGCWDRAKADAEAVLEKDPTHWKARYRFAVALLRLQRLTDAQEVVTRLIDDADDDDDGEDKKKSLIELKQRVLVALGEQNGKYSIPDLVRDAASWKRRSAAADARPFHADYVSPKVDVGCEVPGKGRGVRALEDLVENELITASTAFAWAPVDPCSSTFTFDAFSMRMNDASQSRLLPATIRALESMPSRGKDLYSLSGGKATPMDPTAIDVPRLDRILETNWFGGDGMKALPAAMAAELRAALTEDVKEAKHNDDSSSGLWIREAIFNHSCTPNLNYLTLGNVMLIYAARRIPKGDELCVTYFPRDKSYAERVDICNGWANGEGFLCGCERCSLLRQRPDLARMDAEVFRAYAKSNEAVSMYDVPMAEAMDLAMPRSRRLEIIEAHKDLPLHLQHETVRRCKIMDGATRVTAGEAIDLYQAAADIGYATRGGGGLNVGRMMDLGRLAGASLVCKRYDRAEIYLHQVWSLCLEPFAGTPSDFEDIAVAHVLPWWPLDKNANPLTRLTFIRSLAAKVATKGPSVRAPLKNPKKKTKKKQLGDMS